MTDNNKYIKCLIKDDVKKLKKMKNWASVVAPLLDQIITLPRGRVIDHMVIKNAHKCFEAVFTNCLTNDFAKYYSRNGLPAVQDARSDNFSFTLFESATMFGSKEIVAFLIKYAADNHIEILQESLILMGGDHTIGPVQAAMYHDQIEIFEIILNQTSFDVNELNGRGESTLESAVRNGRTEFVDLLLKHRDIALTKIGDFNNSAYHWAVRVNSKEMLEQLHAGIKRVSAADKLKMMTSAMKEARPPGGRCETQLLQMIRETMLNGGSSGASTIVKNVANNDQNYIDALIADDVTKLQQSLEWKPRIRRLLAANFNEKRLVVQQMLANDCHQCFQLLFDTVDNIDYVQLANVTRTRRPLFIQLIILGAYQTFLCFMKNTRKHKLILQTPYTTIDTSTGSHVIQYGPLHAAIVHQRTDMVDLMLSNRFDPDELNCKGETPLELAINVKNMLLVMHISGYNPDFSFGSHNRYTSAYHQAALENDSNLISALLQDRYRPTVTSDGVALIIDAIKVARDECHKVMTMFISEIVMDNSETIFDSSARNERAPSPQLPGPAKTPTNNDDQLSVDTSAANVAKHSTKIAATKNAADKDVRNSRDNPIKTHFGTPNRSVEVSSDTFPKQTDQPACEHCHSSDRRIDVLVQPCNHVCLCELCHIELKLKKHNKCPVCRSRVKSFTRIRF